MLCKVARYMWCGAQGMTTVRYASKMVWYADASKMVWYADLRKVSLSWTSRCALTPRSWVWPELVEVVLEKAVQAPQPKGEGSNKGCPPALASSAAQVLTIHPPAVGARMCQ